MSEPLVADDGKTQRNRGRCWSCKKKVGLTGFECRCGFVYCGVHRYADQVGLLKLLQLGEGTREFWGQLRRTQWGHLSYALGLYIHSSDDQCVAYVKWGPLNGGSVDVRSSCGWHFEIFPPLETRSMRLSCGVILLWERV